jgi:ABC-type multidrug transport system permease subunit
MLGFMKKKETRVYKERDSSNQREKKDFEALRISGKLKPKAWFQFIIKLFNLIMKNYKLMIRSKTSALIFFFGPLLIVFLLGIGFNNSSLNGINIATYSDSYSPLSESLMGNLSDNQFNIIKTNSEDACVNSVKFESNHICLVFPGNMVLDNTGNNNIDIYVDNSRLNLANQITEKLASKVSLKSSELSFGMVSQILGAVDEINKEAVSGATYLEGMENNYKTSKSKVVSTLSDFDTFDLDYSILDMNPALNEVEDVRETENLSDTDVKGIIDELNNIKLSYNSLAGKLDEASSQLGDMESSVTSLAGSIDSNKANIDALKVGNTKIKTTINTIKITNVDSIVSPIGTVIKPLSLKKNYLIYTFPTLLVLLIMFVSLLMSSISIIREKKSMAYFRNFITPTFEGWFLIGQFLTDISIIFVQLVIILGVASIFLTDLPWQVYIIGGSILLLLASIFILIGLILGYMFNSEESVTTGAVSVGLVFLLFSNAILPVESLTGFLRGMVFYNPFVLGESILKRLILFETNFSSIFEPLYLLLIWFGVVLIGAIVVKVTSRRLRSSYH